MKKVLGFLSYCGRHHKGKIWLSAYFVELAIAMAFLTGWFLFLPVWLLVIFVVLFSAVTMLFVLAYISMGEQIIIAIGAPPFTVAFFSCFSLYETVFL